MGRASKIDWDRLRADYVAENLRVDTRWFFTLEDLARKWNVSPHTVRKRASQERWTQRLRDNQKEQEERCIADAIAESVAKEVWRREVKHASSRAHATLEVLERVPLDNLSKEGALYLLDACSKEEQSALRMAEMIPQTSRFTPDEACEVAEAERRVARRNRSLIERLLKHLDTQHPGWSS